QTPRRRRNLAHRSFEKLPTLPDHDGVDDEHGSSPGTGSERAAPYARHEADSRDEKQDNQRSGKSILRVLPEEFVVEGRASAARGCQAITCFAHILRSQAPLHGGGFRRQRGKIRMFAWNWH